MDLGGILVVLVALVSPEVVIIAVVVVVVIDGYWKFMACQPFLYKLIESQL